ncbi:MAG: hypothetical protein KC466_08270 [Myxococcales bacterium]|nr:hypothetical protein [Myxococcales bacterium]
MPSAHFSPRERLIAGAFAEALFPGGRIVPPGGAATVDRLETILRGFGADTVRGYAVLLHALDLAPLLKHRKRFAAMSLSESEAYLQSWLDGDFTARARLIALSAPVKVAHLDDPAIYRTMGCVYDKRPKGEPPPRWMSQVVEGADVPDEDLECEVVVVGTSAGGAVVAKELAE